MPRGILAAPTAGTAPRHLVCSGVLLDRDGVINDNAQPANDPEGMVLFPWAVGAIRRLNEAGIPVAVVTNQGGVAFGFMTEEDLQRVHERMGVLLAEGGAHVDGVYYCPHHPRGTIARYAKECPDRKPGTGMLARASYELGIDLQKAVLIGDSATDIVAGRRAGCLTIRVGGDSAVPVEPAQDYTPEEAAPDVEQRDLGSAVEFLLEAVDPRLNRLLL